MKWTGTIAATASGSVGGCTFSHNRFGQYVRRRAVPVNPGSSQQLVITAALGSLVAAWKTLTQIQRDGWTNYALNTPREGFGGTIILTGQQMYIACNTPRIQIGTSVVNTPPVVFGAAVLTPPVPTTLVGATDVLSYTFANTDPWAGAVGGFLAVYISRPQSPTTQFFKGPYRFAGLTAGGVVPPTSPQTEVSPFDYAVGQRAHVQFRAMNATGQISPAVRATILAT